LKFKVFFLFQGNQITAFKDSKFNGEEKYFQYDTDEGIKKVAQFERGHLTPAADFDSYDKRVR